MAAAKPPRSLKARALAWLAQREHSRLELQRKLLRAARAAEAGSGAGDGSSAGAPFDPDAARRDIEALLDWLERHDFLAEQRFVESRLHVRAARFGNVRIRQELAQHAVELPEDARRALDESEPARASAVRARRFQQPPDTPQERARQGRFLAARG